VSVTTIRGEWSIIGAALKGRWMPRGLFDGMAGVMASSSYSLR